VGLVVVVDVVVAVVVVDWNFKKGAPITKQVVTVTVLVLTNRRITV